MSNKVRNFKRIKASGNFQGRESTLLKHDSIMTLKQCGSFLSDSFDLNIDINQDEANQLISSIRKNWEKSKFEEVSYKCKKDMMHSVISAFGLGPIVAGYDKVGGNVTTVHNAKQDIYAKNSQEYSRKEYTGQGSSYNKNAKNFRDSRINSDFTITDDYTGKELYYKDENNRSSVDVDHIKSVKSYHQEGGFIQTKKQKQSFAADEGNFAVTDNSINSSMQADEIKEWSGKTNTNNSQQTNAEYYEIDEKKVDEAIERSNVVVENHAPTTTDWTVYYTTELAKTGAKEAGKAGLQLAVGLLLTNLMEILFEEVKDSYENGFIAGANEESFFKALKIRLERIVKHILKDWKNVVIAFRDGAIAGFLSNILTVAINTVFTTAKRLVRMIREGVMSLVRAVKLLIFRPEGMTKEQAADAAMKLLAIGVITGVGIIAEEAISKAVTGFPFADTVSVVLTTSLIAIATSMTMYALDKYDFFGIHEKQSHEFTIKQLVTRIEVADANINNLYDSAINPFGISPSI